MATRLFTRLHDFALNNALALKAYIGKILDEVESQYDSIQTNIADITSVQALIDNIAADSILDRSEKALIVKEVNAIIAEKSGIDTQATALGITTEKTTYDNAYTALINYLNGLSPAYTDTTQDTTIVRATFNTKFNDYYNARQALFNKMDSVASAQSVVIDPFSDVVIYADSTGTVKTGELTRNVAVTASKGNANITTSGTWARTATTGVTCTIGAATGVLAITALTVPDVSVPVSFTYSGVTRNASVHIVRVDDPPTASGSSGSSGSTATTTTLGDTTGTTYDTTNAVSAVLTVTAGAAGKVQCSAPLGFKRTGTTYGENGAYGKWQWRVPAGSWADITTEVQETNTSLAYDLDPWGDGGSPVYTISAGSLTVTQTKTGLTTGSTYEFRFVWRRRDVAGTAANIYRSSGTMTADGTVA